GAAAAPSGVPGAEGRDGWRLVGESTVTPPAATSTTATSSPTGTSSTSARPPPSTVPAEPRATPSVTVTSPPRATAPALVPAASPGRNLARVPSSPAAASTALAMTVGTNGPGATAAPRASTTTTSSGRP